MQHTLTHIQANATRSATAARGAVAAARVPTQELLEGILNK